MYKPLEQTREKHHNPVKRGFEQYRSDQGHAIVTSQQWNFVGDQHCLADHERAQRREHEVAESNQVVGDQ